MLVKPTDQQNWPSNPSCVAHLPALFQLSTGCSCLTNCEDARAARAAGAARAEILRSVLSNWGCSDPQNPDARVMFGGLVGNIDTEQRSTAWRSTAWNNMQNGKCGGLRPSHPQSYGRHGKHLLYPILTETPSTCIMHFLYTAHNSMLVTNHYHQ